MEKLQEQKLRAFIKAGIIKKKKERLEEQIKQALYKNKLRSIVKNILLREATDVNTDTPNRSTGINVLATTLKLVIPIIKQGYEQLTSSPEQRKSFRAHVIQNAINTLVRVDLTTGSEEERRFRTGIRRKRALEIRRSGLSADGSRAYGLRIAEGQ